MSETIARIWEEHYLYDHLSDPEMQLPAEMKTVTRQKLESMLQGEQAELFRKYQTYCEEYLRLAQERAFCKGYSVATKITAEALLEMRKPLILK